MIKNILLVFSLLFLINCKKVAEEKQPFLITENKIETEFATGFDVVKEEGYSVITLKMPWPNATKSFKYLLLDKGVQVPEAVTYDELIRVPVEELVVTSTTHIPALEALGVLDKLVGFPNTNYISSVAARKLVDEGEIKELGKNESINLEVLIELEPDAVVSFGVNGSNKTLNNIKKSGIPVLYNSEWLEQHALGRAEWIKFFGFLFKKEDLANEIFNQITEDYFEAKALAKTVKNKPTVLSGMPFKDTWHIPYGNSWAAQFIDDANAKYLWADKKGKGSIALNFESVLEKAKDADYWIAIGSYDTKEQLLESNLHYQQFDMFQKNNIYMSNKKGETGGLLFYEVAPTRPDLILKDLIKIFHPELLPNYELHFYTQLK
jgi:iron complex transport system substrate-binding protein